MNIFWISTFKLLGGLLLAVPTIILIFKWVQTRIAKKSSHPLAVTLQGAGAVFLCSYWGTALIKRMVQLSELVSDTMTFLLYASYMCASLLLTVLLTWFLTTWGVNKWVRFADAANPELNTAILKAAILIVVAYLLHPLFYNLLESLIPYPEIPGYFNK